MKVLLKYKAPNSISMLTHVSWKYVVTFAIRIITRSLTSRPTSISETAADNSISFYHTLVSFPKLFIRQNVVNDR
jgi:hypothetical protein